MLNVFFVLFNYAIINECTTIRRSFRFKYSHEKETTCTWIQRIQKNQQFVVILIWFNLIAIYFPLPFGIYSTLLFMRCVVCFRSKMIIYWRKFTIEIEITNDQSDKIPWDGRVYVPLHTFPGDSTLVGGQFDINKKASQNCVCFACLANA